MTDVTRGYVCGFSEDDDGGVYEYRLDREQGRLEEQSRLPLSAASFLAVHPDGTHCYVAREVEDGEVVACRLDDSGPVELNRQPTGGAAPAYVSVDATGSYAFVSNYFGGNVRLFPIADDGSLGDPADTVERTGSSVDPDRQDQSHPHSVHPGPENRFVYVPDLGTDEIGVYEIDREADALRPADSDPVTVRDGAGPRHIAFHPDEAFAYVINELDSTITAFDYDAATGALETIGTVGTLPESFDGHNQCADIHVHPSGEWLYGSNRGHDSVAIFAIDGETGRLDPVGHESTRGEWPRNIALGPSGSILFAQNRHSDSIVAFDVDDTTGELSAIGQELALPEPICLAFR